jgi:hypothetical protein
MRPSPRAPHAFRGRHSILAPHVALSLLARRGRHRRSWVRVCRRCGACGRSPTSGALSSLARPPRECHRHSPTLGPWDRHHSPALGAPTCSPSGSGSHHHRATEYGNHRHDFGSRNHCSPGVRYRRALSGNRHCRTGLSWRHRSCIGVVCQKLSPNALGLVL